MTFNEILNRLNEVKQRKNLFSLLSNKTDTYTILCY